MNKANKKRFELLAPAGDMDSAVAAFKNGADAIYAGLNKFNARERTENFSPQNMGKLIEYANKHSKKVYITLNTLIKESELDEIAEYLAELYNLSPHAIIVQDIGLIRLIREFFPALPIHASTQLGVHNSAGIEVLQEMGVSRVILERQVTLEEVRTIISKTDMEIEVFIHGALCCSLSGQCLFSSWIGGWSGNRGKCKQPCRRRFFSNKGNGFFFSTKDLYTLEHIHILKELGITSFKIEGRLRKADYVGNTVNAYRKILDIDGIPSKKQIAEAKNILSKSPGRKWSEGFLSRNSMETLISHTSIGALGSLCGIVTQTSKNGFFLNPKKPLHIGDRLRIQSAKGEDGPAFTLTKMSVNNRFVKSVSSYKDKLFIFCDKPVNNGDRIYKIGESYGNLRRTVENLTPVLIRPLDFRIIVKRCGITIKFDSNLKDWHYAAEFPKAEKHPLTRTTVYDLFSKLSTSICKVGKVSVEIQDKIFIPASELKKIYKIFKKEITEKVTKESFPNQGALCLAKFYKSGEIRKEKQREKRPTHVSTVVCVNSHKHIPKNLKCGVCVSIFASDIKKTDEVLLPSFCSEHKLDELAHMVKTLYMKGVRKFRISSIYGLHILKPYKDIDISVSFSIPVCNSLCAEELREKFPKIKKVQAWIELEKEAIEALIKNSSVLVEIYRYGRPPLLATRASIPVSGKIYDSRKNCFLVRQDRNTGLTFVYPKEVFSVPELKGSGNFFDLSHAGYSNSNNKFSLFNFNHILK